MLSVSLNKSFLSFPFLKCRSIKFIVHIQSKLCQHTPVMGTHSSYQMGYLSWTVVGSSNLLEVRERDVAQLIACPPLKRSVIGSILLSGPSCSLGYFPFQPVVHNWFIKGRGMYCSVYGKVHIKYPLLLIEKSSLCGGSGFPSKKCVNVTI